MLRRFRGQEKIVIGRSFQVKILNIEKVFSVVAGR